MDGEDGWRDIVCVLREAGADWGTFNLRSPLSLLSGLYASGSKRANGYASMT
jgi:hypothetical protein